MLEDAILVWGINFESALSEHSNEGYAILDDVHRLFRAHLDDSLVAPALTMHGHVKVEVDEYFELAAILEAKSLQ